MLKSSDPQKRILKGSRDLVERSRGRNVEYADNRRRKTTSIELPVQLIAQEWVAFAKDIRSTVGT
jgi:hypothetical protein